MSRRTLIPGLALAAALAAAGCDTGGLLVVEGSSSSGGPVVAGHSASDLVSGGTVAKNSSYKLVYTVGQGTPNQNVDTSANNRLNGGLVGAVNGKP